MLTIIPLSSTPPKEETLKTQLGINISISDFLIKTEDPQIIINSIVNIIKEEKKSDKIIYDKLISLFSFYITSKSYTFNETNIKQIVSNLSKVISTLDNNSNYTLFIRMGSTGGNQAVAQDAIQVYGQWNGTNLDAYKAPATMN